MPAARFFIKGDLENNTLVRLLRSRLSSCEAEDLTSAQIALLVSTGEKHGTELALWAHRQGIASISVYARPHEIMVGPLNIPKRAGCAHCALARLRCSEVVTEPEYLTIVDDICLNRAVDLIAGELTRAAVDPMQSSLLNHVVFLRTGDEDESAHRFLMLPRCEVCGDDAKPPRPPEVSISDRDDAETAIAVLAGLVDSRVGIVSQIIVEEPEDTGVELPIVVTALPPRVIANNELHTLPSGWGKGLTLTGALISAVGETIERYSASLADKERICWSRMDALEGETLDPREFALYSDAQYSMDGFPYIGFDPSVAHPWIQGMRLDGKTPIWVPAIFAFLSLDLRRENLICQGTSNGLAASTTAEDAMLRAILELIERDAFMAAWFTGSGGMRIEASDALDPSLRTIIKGLQDLGAKVELYLLPTSVIGSTVLGIAYGDGRSFPGATIGLGADLDPISALRQAVIELGQTGPYLRRMMSSGILKAPVSAGNVTSMLEHAAYYFIPERAAAFDWIRTKEPPIPVGELAAATSGRSLEQVRLDLEKAGIRVALVDVTSRDLESSPFYIYRAISPDLQPITYGFGLDRMPVKRIRSLGLASFIPEIHPIW